MAEEENTELNAQSESDEETEETGGINEEHAEELAHKDYQGRMDEWDSADASKPVMTVPATGESGPVEMPKPE